tara:strand:+ start:968 stop:1384 length:417 start_codon:yes stop_codon:yes gene_type:complete
MKNSMRTAHFHIYQNARRASYRRAGIAILILFAISWLSSINMVQLSITAVGQGENLRPVVMSASMMSEHCNHEGSSDSCDSVAADMDCSAAHCSIIGVLMSSIEPQINRLGYEGFKYFNRYYYLASSPPYTPPITLPV